MFKKEYITLLTWLTLKYVYQLNNKNNLICSCTVFVIGLMVEKTYHDAQKIFAQYL
jgi:hypothetical protein